MSNVVALRADMAVAAAPIAAERGQKVEDNKRSGFVLLYRSVQDAPFKQHPERFCVWIHLLMEAGFETTEVTFNRNVIRRRRGQVVTSARQLAAACGVTEDSARRSLEHFKQEGMVTLFTKRGARGYSLVTLANYDDYQRGIAQTYSAGLHADLKPTPALALTGDSAEYNADYHAECDAEDLNNKTTKQSKDLNTSCPVSGETGPHQENKHAGADAVIDCLNKTVGSRYQKKPSSRKPINGRLNEGHSAQDLQLVVAFKHEHWANNPEFSQYLRPATLFGTEKFNGYLSAAQRWHEIGRPKCVNGEWEGFERRKSGGQVAQAQAQSRAYQAEHGPAYDDNTKF
ncbi:MAG: conserved phage C-terminal domain-containing protein [Oceanisphaera sp.]|uniref:conserved phage C-terminal domain-containing protein n=1 Tax=Oceanisphaera sp. TaxID=1929979 RepID=UPI003C7199A2